MRHGVMRISSIGAAAVGAALVAACAQLQSLGLATKPLDDATIASGLKEALRVGIERAVADTSRPDGFLGNDRIRIPLPEKLQSVADTLRKIGLDKPVEDLVVAMNRGAEKASAEAADVFVGAIERMTLADARGILQGGPTAATDFFRAKTEDELRAKFEPIVAAKLDAVGGVRTYNDLLSRYRALPFVPKPPQLRLERFVTDKALDGLFVTLGREEARIREDPRARATALLKQVFGSI